jgi:hypothetical protein
MRLLGQNFYQQLGYPQKANGEGGAPEIPSLISEEGETLLTEEGEIIELE